MTEYVPSTYTNDLTRRVARTVHVGQGAHLEGNTDDVTRALVRLTASCYAFLATEVANVLSIEKADPLLRDAVRGFGRYRGKAIRREVESRGLPLDVRHLLDYWDLPSPEEAWSMNNRDRTAHYDGYDVPGCPFHDYYRRLCPQPLAILICEEVHVAVAKEFNPAIEVWYPALLTRGQAKCVFRWSMPLEATERASYHARRACEAARKSGKPLAGERQPEMTDAPTSYRLMARLHALLYHFIVNELLRAVGEEQTEDILKRAMRKWGAWRGKMMAEDHQKRGWLLNMEKFITYFDDPAAGDAWIADNVILTPSEHTKDVTTSPYTTIFDKLGTGRFAAPMFEEVLPAQAKAYNPDIQLSIPMLMERGDSISRLCYSMSD